MPASPKPLDPMVIIFKSKSTTRAQTRIRYPNKYSFSASCKHHKKNLKFLSPSDVISSTVWCIRLSQAVGKDRVHFTPETGMYSVPSGIKGPSIPALIQALRECGVIRPDDEHPQHQMIPRGRRT
ncbi:hypothetical protein Pelo_619 [Pelomyxa schiedti]|nr:hypothetical protein Pelo_619 [Pelomyxa schiedti]